jgi:hypothetical protein
MSPGYEIWFLTTNISGYCILNNFFSSHKLKTPRPNWHYPTPKHRGGQKATAVWPAVIQKRPCFCVKYFLSFSQIYLSREELRQKKLSNFAKLQLFGTLQFGKIGVLFNFIKQEFKFFKIAQLFFCLSSTCERKIWGNQRKYYVQKSGPRKKLPRFSFKKAK